MVEEVLICLSLIIVIASIATIIARIIGQPPMIAYIVSGVLAGPLVFNIIGGDSSEMIQIFSHLGVAFLLFIVGLSLDLRLLKEVGKVSVLAGFVQIILTAGFGFLISWGLGFSTIVSVYLALILAFSSTIVVVKILSDKKEIDTLHGRIALGILIIQDLVAAIVLMAVPLINSGRNFNLIFYKLGIIIILVGLVFLFTHFILSKFLIYLARSQETLFLFGVAWALVLASVFFKFGFSLEIGALIAGMSLASSKYNLELGSKLKPLRDFFVVLFFVFFGSQLNGSISFEIVKYAIIFSLFILVGKPLIVMTTLKFFGYKKRTNFLAGSSLAQISEFSLVLILLGFNLGHLSRDVMSIVVLVALITIAISSYGIYHSHILFGKISNWLNLFEGNKYELYEKPKGSYDIYLFGYHRIGYKILQELREMKSSFVVIDSNPKVILSLSKHRINCIYGDGGDKNFLDEIGLEKAKIIISTIPDEGVNITLKEKLQESNKNAIFIATAENPRIALDLYNLGIDYVIVPHHLGGEYAADLIQKFKTKKEFYKEEGKKHLKELNDAKRKSEF